MRSELSKFHHFVEDLWITIYIVNVFVSARIKGPKQDQFCANGKRRNKWVFSRFSNSKISRCSSWNEKPDNCVSFAKFIVFKKLNGTLCAWLQNRFVRIFFSIVWLRGDSWQDCLLALIRVYFTYRGFQMWVNAATQGLQWNIEV